MADPDRVRALVEPPARSFETERAAALDRLAGQDASAYVSLLDRCAHLDPDARRMLALRVGELIDYQDARYAAEYVAFVLEVAAREAAMAPGRAEVTHAVIRNLYKLMAYKDEYEVARAPPEAGVPRGDAGALRRAPPPRLASPPAAPPRARTQAEAAARALVPARAPGPAGDSGASGGRRTTRSATPPSAAKSAAWCPGTAALVLDGLAAGGADAHATAVELARLPEAIRGYEDIKLRYIATVRERASRLLG